MHLLADLDTNFFVNNERKKYRFALRNRSRQGRKGGSEAGDGEREERTHFHHWNRLPGEGGCHKIRYYTCENLEYSVYLTEFKFWHN